MDSSGLLVYCCFFYASIKLSALQSYGGRFVDKNQDEINFFVLNEAVILIFQVKFSYFSLDKIMNSCFFCRYFFCIGNYLSVFLLNTEIFFRSHIW